MVGLYEYYCNYLLQRSEVLLSQLCQVQQVVNLSYDSTDVIAFKYSLQGRNQLAGNISHVENLSDFRRHFCDVFVTEGVFDFWENFISYDGDI